MSQTISDGGIRPSSNGAGGSGGGGAGGLIPQPDSSVLNTSELGLALSNINKISTSKEKVKYMRKYMDTMGIHKATDMKHDHLGIETLSGNKFFHFNELIPQTYKKSSSINLDPSTLFSSLDDDKFLNKHLKLFSIDDDTEVKFDGLSGLVDKISKVDSGTLKLNIYFNTDDGSESPIYTFQTIRKTQYNTSPDAVTFLNDLDIQDSSIFNVDFQYKLWDILKQGSPDSRKIYLKKTSENENDPAGKYNITESIFRSGSGADVLFAINLQPQESIYKSFDDRIANLDDLTSIIDTDTPDFFSRFDVAIGPLIPLKTCFGYFDRFSSRITISDKYAHFSYSSDAKQDNSNKTVRKRIQQLYAQHLKSGIQLIDIACEAAKKASGDDAQLLSQRNTKNQSFTILDPKHIRVPGNDAYTALKTAGSVNIPLTGTEYFVSHDGPTCVRNLLEGCNLLLMHVSGWAIKIERGIPIPQSDQQKIKGLIKILEKPMFNLSKDNIIQRQTIYANRQSYIYDIYGRGNLVRNGYNRILEDLFKFFIREHVTPSQYTYTTTYTSGSLQQIFKASKQMLMMYLCLSHLQEYLHSLPVNLITISPEEYTFITRLSAIADNQVNTVAPAASVDLNVLLEKLRILCKQQQLELEYYKNISDYINSVSVPQYEKLKDKVLKKVLLLPEGQTLHNWNIFYDVTRRGGRGTNVNPLYYPLNLLFIDKLSEYLIDQQKHDLVQLFDVSHVLEAKMTDVMVKANCSDFHANLLCKLTFEDVATKKKDNAFKDLRPIAANDELLDDRKQSTSILTNDFDEYKLDNVPNDIRDIPKDTDIFSVSSQPILIQGGKKIIQGGRTTFNSITPIYKSTHEISLTKSTNFTFYTDLFSNLYNTMFYDITQILLESRSDPKLFSEQYDYYSTIISRNISNLKKLELIAYLQDNHSILSTVDTIIDIFMNSDYYDTENSNEHNVEVSNDEPNAEASEVEDQIEKPQKKQSNIISMFNFIIIIISILVYSIRAQITGGSKKIKDKFIDKKEEISPLKDAHLLINNMFDTMQNKMIDNAYLRNFIIHMILNKRMTDVFKLCHKAMYSNPTLEIFKVLFKDGEVPEGFSDFVQNIQKDFMKTIEFCLSNILFLLSPEEDGCTVIRESAFELSDDTDISSFHFINRQSLYLILGSITIPDAERKTLYKNAKAAFESPYWKFFYQMMGGKEYIIQLFRIFNAIGSEKHYKMIDFLSKLDMNQEFTIEYIQDTLGKSIVLDANNRQSLYDKYNEFCRNFSEYSTLIFSPKIEHRQVTRKAHSARHVTRKVNSARLHKEDNKNKILRTQSAPFPKTSFTRKKKLPSKINTSSPEITNKALSRSISPKKTIEIKAIQQTPKPKIKLSTTISPKNKRSSSSENLTRKKPRYKNSPDKVIDYNRKREFNKHNNKYSGIESTPKKHKLVLSQ